MTAEIFYLSPEFPIGDAAGAAAYMDAIPRIRVIVKSPWATEDFVTRSITITPRLQSVFVPGSTDGFRFSMTVDEADGLDKRIFLHLAGPTNIAGDREARFQKVCSPSDLVSSPADDPAPNANPAWFRLDSITLDFRSRMEAMETHDAVIADAALLLKSLAYMDKLDAGSPITISVGD